MYEIKQVGSGITWALTVALIYPLCAVAFTLWPTGAFAFLSALFHGADFTGMRTAAAGTTFRQVFMAFCGIVVLAFVVGVVYAWMNNLTRALLFGKSHGYP
jgi:hypothetical protein